MTGESIKKKLLATTLLVGLSGGIWAGAAVAQETDEPVVVQQEDEDDGAAVQDTVVITGSRIARQIGDAPTPVTLIDQEQANLSGFNNLGDFLSDIPALQGSQVPDDTTGAVLNAAGLTLLNLRNLGTNRTLVLIDGKRQVASQAGTAAVDVGSIPFNAIERTEVLTGGASSIYGADAVSGVVNFITRQNFEGLEFDANYAVDETGSNDSFRLSGLLGSNFADDKGNAFIAIEHRETDELLNSQVDFLEQNATFQRLDTDVDLDGDGFLDANGIPNFGLFEDGTLSIINRSALLNIFAPSAVNPNGTSFTFAPDGTAIPFDPGLDPGFTGNTRIGGDGLPLNDLSQSLTPDNQTTNLLARVTYDVLPRVTAYIDGRYSYSRSRTTFQPSFFGGGTPNAIGTAGDDRVLDPGIFGRSFFTATDNAFLDPAAGAAIEGAFGLADVQRFQFEFNRAQDARREIFRFVGGLEGDFDSPFDEASQWNWDLAFNFGRSNTVNRQLGTRLNDAFFAGADAIQINDADIATIAANGGDTGAFNVGDIVCRVQFLDAANLDTSLQAIGSIGQDVIDNCVPFSIFGDGAISPEGAAFASADLNDFFEQEQVNIIGSVSGDLVDLWGAGPILFAAGFEYRDELSITAPDELPLERNTFANVIQPTVGSFDVIEGFAEFVVPVVSDIKFAENLELNGAVRVSDYSTVGTTTAWNVGATYEPITDLTFRGGYAVAVRAPNIGELFQAPSQTFAQIGDPCDVQNINGGPNPAARIANCAALGVPVGFVDPNPNISNVGTIAGNPDLLEEESTSFFAGVTYRPTFLPELIFAIDYFNIEIEDAIANLGIGGIAAACVDGDNGPNAAFCDLVPRNFEGTPATNIDFGEISGFLSAPVNIGFFETEGVDFQAQYGQDLDELIGQYVGTGDKDIGNIGFGLTGTYLLSQDAQTDPADDTTFDDNAGEVGLPEWRFVLNTFYNYDAFTFTYSLNWQSSQDVFQNALQGVAGSDPVEDIPEEFLRTGSFAQHDFNVQYEINDNMRLRAGIVNAFDNEPPLFAQNNIFDFFGRRFFIGTTINF